MRTLSNAAIAAMMILIWTSGALAQEPCVGPGAAFGIVGYQCGDCTMQLTEGDPRHPVWRFRAEPVVLRTAAGSMLQSGDIIEAVGGKPITTAAGAQLFTYPAPGNVELTVRRGGRQLALTVRAAVCASRPDDEHTSSSAPASGASTASKSHGRFGFAIACGGCTRQVRAGGISLWTFTSNPTIGDVDPDGPAARAGLRSGDVLVAVDGHSLLDEAGARALGQADQARSLRLTVERPDYTRKTMLLEARDAKPD